MYLNHPKKLRYFFIVSSFSFSSDLKYFSNLKSPSPYIPKGSIWPSFSKVLKDVFSGE